MPPRYEVIGVEGLPEIAPGDDLASLIAGAAARQGTPLSARDLLVVSQKIVSKSEGRMVRLSEVTPSPHARALAEELGRDPRLTEVILSESRRVVRKEMGLLIVETHHGWVCANAGVDQSNVDADTACLLPEDADRSARALRDRLRELTGHELAIIIADTFGRPWREGLANVGAWINGHFHTHLDVPLYEFGIFGVILVVVMLFRPEGLIPSQRRAAEFREGVQDTPLYDTAGPDS